MDKNTQSGIGLLASILSLITTWEFLQKKTLSIQPQPLRSLVIGAISTGVGFLTAIVTKITLNRFYPESKDEKEAQEQAHSIEHAKELTDTSPYPKHSNKNWESSITKSQNEPINQYYQRY